MAANTYRPMRQQLKQFLPSYGSSFIAAAFLLAIKSRAIRRQRSIGLPIGCAPKDGSDIQRDAEAVSQEKLFSSPWQLPVQGTLHAQLPTLYLHFSIISLLAQKARENFTSSPSALWRLFPAHADTARSSLRPAAESPCSHAARSARTAAAFRPASAVSLRAPAPPPRAPHIAAGMDRNALISGTPSPLFRQFAEKIPISLAFFATSAGGWLLYSLFFCFRIKLSLRYATRTA